jgi:PII-like signaling protein
VNEDCLKLTTYFGERDRVGRGFLADALMDRYARAGLHTSVVMRGAEGFGLKHHLHTDRLLSLSEDLPMVAVAVDTRERIEAVAVDVAKLSRDGLITLERAVLLHGAGDGPVAKLPPDVGDAVKLTVYTGRGHRAAGAPAHIAVVDLLHRHGVAGATVLLGVDGTAGGVRHRARFFGANAGVPLMIVSIGDAAPISRALPDLQALLPGAPVTIERVRVCKRDGARLARPADTPGGDPAGQEYWGKLTVACGEQSRHDGLPLAPLLLRSLREAGARGATAIRGIWGYHGDHAPHGDTFFQLRRRVPVLVVIVDRPDRIGEWFDVVDAHTDETGLVTSELVPAPRSGGHAATGAA